MLFCPKCGAQMMAVPVVTPPPKKRRLFKTLWVIGIVGPLVVFTVSTIKSSRDVAGEYVLPPSLSIGINAERGPQSEVYMAGPTNFPDGMKM